MKLWEFHLCYFIKTLSPPTKLGQNPSQPNCSSFLAIPLPCWCGSALPALPSRGPLLSRVLKPYPMASSASSRSSKGHKDKDPNQPDYEKIVLTEKYKTYIKEIDNEQQKWIDYKNQIRRCRNSYMEASSIFQGKIRNRELKRFADEFHSLSDKIPEKMEAVTKVGGNPLPLERHLMALPSMGPKKGKK